MDFPGITGVIVQATTRIALVLAVIIAIDCLIILQIYSVHWVHSQMIVQLYYTMVVAYLTFNHPYLINYLYNQIIAMIIVA
jgi:hypothetical protein